MKVTRRQVLAFRRRVSGLDERLPFSATSLRTAAWAGLQDSMPRAALLSIHARVAKTTPDTWEHPSLAQVWGPRFSAFVVAERDRAIFTLGRMPRDAKVQREMQALADRLEAFLDGRRLPYGQAGRGLGLHPNALRYATYTGRIAIRWEGARQPVIGMVPAPAISADKARLELARRYLHVFGPASAEGFAEWAGVKPTHARHTFEALAKELVPVRTPVGDGVVLRSDEELLRRAAAGKAAPARLLPSGDTYFLLQGRDRELVVPDRARRAELWTPRVWPGAVVLGNDVVGTWRRAGAVVAVSSWRRLGASARDAIEHEAHSFPLRDGPMRVRWET